MSRSVQVRRPKRVVKVAVPESVTPADEKVVPETGKVTAELGLLSKLIRVCTKCPLCSSRTIAVPGEGRPDAQVMVIGEGPGAKEDQLGKPFVGNAGRYLDHVLEGTGLNREDLFITNIVKCRPPGNRAPRAGEVQTCTSLYLFRQIELLRPHIILLLGSVAVKTVLDLPSVEKARGFVIERDGRLYLASYHPAVRFYREELAEKIRSDFALLRSEILKLKQPA